MFTESTFFNAKSTKFLHERAFPERIGRPNCSDKLIAEFNIFGTMVADVVSGLWLALFQLHTRVLERKPVCGLDFGPG